MNKQDDLYDVALDFLIDALERGEIETGLPKNSQGKGGYSISNDATQRLADLIQSQKLAHGEMVIGENEDDLIYTKEQFGGPLFDGMAQMRNRLRAEQRERNKVNQVEGEKR